MCLAHRYEYHGNVVDGMSFNLRQNREKKDSPEMDYLPNFPTRIPFIASSLIITRHLKRPSETQNVLDKIDNSDYI